MSPDYKSLTKIQQAGHNQGQNTNDDYQLVRARIAEQTKDLRKSHFALGKDNTIPQTSSNVLFKAPSTKALIFATSENKEAREKTQKSNFTIKDKHGSGGPNTTQSQANNHLLKGQWDKGQLSTA